MGDGSKEMFWPLGSHKGSPIIRLHMAIMEGWGYGLSEYWRELKRLLYFLLLCVWLTCPFFPFLFIWSYLVVWQYSKRILLLKFFYYYREHRCCGYHLNPPRVLATQQYPNIRSTVLQGILIRCMVQMLRLSSERVQDSRISSKAKYDRHPKSWQKCQFPPSIVRCYTSTSSLLTRSFFFRV